MSIAVESSVVRGFVAVIWTSWSEGLVQLLPMALIESTSSPSGIKGYLCAGLRRNEGRRGQDGELRLLSLPSRKFDMGANALLFRASGIASTTDGRLRPTANCKAMVQFEGRLQFHDFCSTNSPSATKVFTVDPPRAVLHPPLVHSHTAPPLSRGMHRGGVGLSRCRP
jgi:hypothetical protein